MKDKVTTIADIAKLAQVSKSTVSRAMNDSPLIALETRERIQEIAKLHHFCLNASARQLTMRESRTIAFVTHGYHKNFSVDDLFTLEIMGGISRCLHENGYDMLVIHLDHGQKDWARKYIDSGKVAGFILMTSGRKQDQISELTRISAPFIVWGVPKEKHCCNSICGDNYTGGYLAADYLIKKGRKRIAFIGGPTEEGEIQMRLEGYQAALNAAEFPLDTGLLNFGNFSPVSGYRAMDELLTENPGIDGVVVASDLMALGVIRAIHSHRLQVPGDIAVVGYDDLSIAKLSTPSLTTISQNVPEAGRLLVQNLLDSLKTGTMKSITLPVEVVVRDSA